MSQPSRTGTTAGRRLGASAPLVRLTPPLARRAVLRGAGGAAIALPFLQAMLGRARKAYAADPKRFIVFYHPQGVNLKTWNPRRRSTTDWDLSESLTPLAPHKQDVVVVQGLRTEAAYHGPSGQPHDSAFASLLTGIECLRKGPGGACTSVPDGSHGGPSIDQEIAKAIGGGTKFRSLELSPLPPPMEAGCGGGSLVQDHLSYRGPWMPNPAERRAENAFARLFGEGVGAQQDTAAIKRALLRKQSVLDTIKADFASLNARLGGADRVRVDQHLSAIRDIERRIQTMTAESAACVVPMKPPASPTGTSNGFIPEGWELMNNLPRLGRIHMDLMVMAMACDLTRVGTLQWGTGTYHLPFPWLGFTGDYHWHWYPGDAVAEPMVTKIVTWYAQQFAYLLDKLKELPEAGGTMLDNSLALWVSEFSYQGMHDGGDRQNLPVVLGGRAGGKLVTNRSMLFPQTAQNGLLISLLHLFGIPATTFGNPAYCKGPLPGLV